MKLPDTPQPIEVSSHDESIVVGVTDWGHPIGVQFKPSVLSLSGAELAHRVMTLYNYAKTIALAVRNVEHERITGNWVSSWPTPTHVEILQSQLTI
ncbi:hypothetical protein KL864_16830 [Mycolicibacterium goodii]|uniref:hypothetical protein n=1 Tax=Mycolicibacterium goodii TaxID=134601 RepID=UPI0011151081|nr:hypothetical protein [Mycolicibacterium goodii]MBU8817568.1 hypothetical protein [Mycolicibacterium goodii]